MFACLRRGRVFGPSPDFAAFIRDAFPSRHVSGGSSRLIARRLQPELCYHCYVFLLHPYISPQNSTHSTCALHLSQSIRK